VEREEEDADEEVDARSKTCTRVTLCKSCMGNMNASAYLVIDVLNRERREG